MNIKMNLRLFDLNTQTTGTGGLSPQMKTLYSDYIIDNATPNLIHDQFGQKQPIGKRKGKTIEFRKLSPLPKALTPLQEGVTPSGGSLNWSTITATIQQYGHYITISDMLTLTAIDDNLVHATKILGNQAGETLDTVTREILNAGTNVQYAAGQVVARYLLNGGDANPTNNHYLSVDSIRRAVRNLKVNKTKKINGYYVAIAHPDTLHDIMGDDDWVSASEYAGSTQLFEGEVGKIRGVRFVETTEAKVFHAEDLSSTRNLTVSSVAGKVITIKEALTAGQATALTGRKILVKDYQYTVASAASGAAGAATVTVVENIAGGPANNDIIYPGEAGAKGRDVYSTLVLGEDAYGTIPLEGGALENIIKQLGSGGTEDPLNQRATTGWKATKTAVILVQNYMCRIETASTFEIGAN